MLFDVEIGNGGEGLLELALRRDRSTRHVALFDGIGSDAQLYPLGSGRIFCVGQGDRGKAAEPHLPLVAAYPHAQDPGLGARCRHLQGKTAETTYAPQSGSDAWPPGLKVPWPSWACRPLPYPKSDGMVGDRVGRHGTTFEPIDR